MESILGFFKTLCIIFIAEGILRMLLPSEKFESAYKNVLSAFILLIIVSGIVSGFKNFKADDIRLDNNITNKESLTDEMWQSAAGLAEKEAEGALKKALDENKIPYSGLSAKVNAESGSLRISKISVKASPDQYISIKNIIIRALNIAPDVIVFEKEE